MRPFPLIIIFTALMLVGLVLVPGLGVQLHPSATLPSMRISFSWPGVPAINVEREVTSVIEGSLATLSNVEEINSVSSRGRGQIDVRFKKGVDMEMARFEIASRIRRLYPGLPDGVSYPQVSVNRAVGRNTPMLIYTVLAPESSHVIADYIEGYVLPRVSQIKGVDQLNFFGVNPKEYQLIYDTRKLEMLGLTSGQLVNALQNHFGENFLGMGAPDRYSRNEQIKIPVMLRPVQNTENMWQHIPVGQAHGKMVFLEDVATTQLVEAEARSYYRINGQTTLMMTVLAQQGANQIRLAGQVRNAIDQLGQQMPPGWQVILTYDDTDFIRKDLRRVGYRMLLSFTILMVFVILISRRVKYLLMIGITVLANLLLAVAWYHLFNIEIHLYSLAGITVSFGIIIDNSIVMIEHMRHQGNKKVFLAILAATFTTLGSLSVIFLLSSQQQAQLGDFAAVVLVNLALSLLVAWFFIPALMTKIRIDNHARRQSQKTLRRKAKAVTVYFRTLSLIRRFRWLMFLIIILGFGIPVHLLPSSVEGESRAASIYNTTIGSSFYQLKLKNSAEKILGGSFRLFSRFVFERSYFTDPERTTLYVRGQMPDGATIHQLNEAVLQMEHFLAGFPQIEQYQSRVTSPDNSMITILFKPQYDRGSFPHVLQGQIIRKAVSIGGAEWSVWGVGQGFSNVLRTGGGSSHIILEGYNYDMLYRYAEILIDKAKDNPRVSNPRILGGDPYRSITRMEFFLQPHHQHMALRKLTLADVFGALNEKVMYRHGPSVFHQNRPLPVRLISDNHLSYTVWDMENIPLHIAGSDHKTSGLISLEKRAMGNDIFKFNQEYRLTVNFNFLGPHILEERVRSQLIDEMNTLLPLGYRARAQQWSWHDEKSRQYLLIFLVIAIIYFVCAILLESLLQPLAVIGLIPISFAGLFLTFYLFELNFDQGGWAAFILLSGLAVNAGLYILNDFNNFRNSQPGRNLQTLYLKAFQYKITPVLLTISSTVIGLIPFVIGQREPFWFAFAAGTMGGLVFSLLGVFFFFPVFLRLGAKAGKSKPARLPT
ncbi:MAG: efflux RND transporter permease subunit [Bacteroidia bacterium]|nr:MAG: efflux RND transporter permease subunit [Bacteroidia bacterium]